MYGYSYPCPRLPRVRVSLFVRVAFNPSPFLRFQRVFFYLFFSSRSFPNRAMSKHRIWDQYQGWTQQLLEAIKGVRPAEGWPGLLGNIALNLGVGPRAGPPPNPRGFLYTSGAVRSRLRPELVERRGRDRVRNPEQFRENLPDEIGIVSEIAVIRKWQLVCARCGVVFLGVERR